MSVDRDLLVMSSESCVRSRWRQKQLFYNDGGRTRAPRTCLRATGVKQKLAQTQIAQWHLNM